MMTTETRRDTRVIADTLRNIRCLRSGLRDYGRSGRPARSARSGGAGCGHDVSDVRRLDFWRGDHALADHRVVQRVHRAVRTCRTVEWSAELHVGPAGVAHV